MTPSQPTSIPQRLLLHFLPTRSTPSPRPLVLHIYRYVLHPFYIDWSSYTPFLNDHLHDRCLHPSRYNDWSRTPSATGPTFLHSETLIICSRRRERECCAATHIGKSIVTTRKEFVIAARGKVALLPSFLPPPLPAPRQGQRRRNFHTVFLVRYLKMTLILRRRRLRLYSLINT